MSKEQYATPHKTSKIKKSTLFEILRYPKGLEIPSIKSDLKTLPKDDSFVWFGHSSLMLIIGGKRILIDPILDGVASPVGGFFKPFKGADIFKASDLPHIDYLLITHNHYDHLNKKTIKNLIANSGISKAFAPLGVGKTLSKWGVKNITELDWWECVEINSDLRLHCFPTRHFSGRFLMDSNKTLWGSFALECAQKMSEQKQKSCKKIYLSGDGGYGEHFSRIGEKMGGFDIAFIENGQYNAQWAKIHLFPNESLQACIDLRTKIAVPIHNSKFKLSTHEWSEPLESFSTLYENALKNGRIDFALLTPLIGEIVPLWQNLKANPHECEPNKSNINKWWRI